MIRPPPRSTLFPSTALFRSVEIGRDGLEARQQRDAEEGEPAPDVDDDHGHHGRGRLPEPGDRLTDQAEGLERHVDEADRKSTRLNSSHSQISYAVFCLTKKL